VRERDPSIHISVSEDQVNLINDKVKQKDFRADLKIDNERKTEKELIDELKKIVKLNKG
jgi:hypothetical protein